MEFPSVAGWCSKSSKFWSTSDFHIRDTVYSEVTAGLIQMSFQRIRAVWHFKTGLSQNQPQAFFFFFKGLTTYSQPQATDTRPFHSDQPQEPTNHLCCWHQGHRGWQVMVIKNSTAHCNFTALRWKGSADCRLSRQGTDWKPGSGYRTDVLEWAPEKWLLSWNRKSSY